MQLFKDCGYAAVFYLAFLAWVVALFGMCWLVERFALFATGS
jgi:hypothetical protein